MEQFLNQLEEKYQKNENVDLNALISEIQNGFITDIEKAKHWLELIEIIDQWNNSDFEYDFYHEPLFENGKVTIFSSVGEIEDCLNFEYEIDFVNGELLLNGENLSEYDFLGGDAEGSMIVLMNVIEFQLVAYI
ncbi:hypothetical protein V7146_11455 [Gottfriedia acidiceleris]|uniref:hypothetical protein n=1 Tax=Gottfriedia acidiceleris TaxID=371036 RepID=UPI002FFF34EE